MSLSNRLIDKIDKFDFTDSKSEENAFEILGSQQEEYGDQKQTRQKSRNAPVDRKATGDNKFQHLLVQSRQ